MKSSELGRSMVEMLSVLAIIGVLSIGGVLGLRYALDKKSANDILYDVNVLATLVQTDEMLDHMAIGQEISERKLAFIKSSPATFTVGKETEKTIYIDVSNVPEKVCTKLLKSDPASVEEIIANVGDGCLEGNENSVVFYLNENMTKDTQNPDRFKRCKTSADCGTCGECKSEICVENANLCGSDKPHCVNMNCSACPSGQVISGAQCMSCDFGGNISSSTADSCRNCSNRFYAGTTEAGGSCQLCSFSGSISNVRRSDCVNCLNRYWTGYGGGSALGACRLCNGRVSEDETACLWDCPAGYVGADSQCYLCSGTTTEILNSSSLASCRQCPDGNRVYSGISEISGGCYLCNYASDIGNTRRLDCLKCANRYWRGTYVNEDSLGICSFCTGQVSSNGTACSWQCPEGQVGSGGGCLPCNSSTISLVLSSRSSCHQCSNRLYDGVSETNGTCRLCSFSGNISTVSLSDCQRCGNRFYSGGVCRFCTGTVSQDGTACVP